MSDDYKATKSALGKIHQSMGTINSLANPPYLSALKSMETFNNLVNPPYLSALKSMETIASLANPPYLSVFKSMATINSLANPSCLDVVKQTTALSTVAENLYAAHPSWLDQIGSRRHEIPKFSQVQTIAELALCNISPQLTATERLVSGIDFKAMSVYSKVDTPTVSRMENALGQAVATYDDLVLSMRDISDVMRLPAFVLPGATREIFTTSFALDTLRPENERDEDATEADRQLVAEAELSTSGCIDLLKQINPKLTRLYIGAREALNSNNVDKVRHVLISLRELWSHLLGDLAPDHLVINWVANQQGLVRKGKPTREDRILYICRDLHCDPLTEFLHKDTEALVELLIFFNHIHELDTKLTDKQLQGIIFKTDSWLMYILKIWEESEHRPFVCTIAQ